MLHTADIHLDCDGYGDASQQAAERARHRDALTRIVDRALADRADLLAIAGDLFDHNRALDETVAFVRRELARLGRPVVILPGNHDSFSTNAIHDRHDMAAGAPHVHVIRGRDGQTIDFPELDLVVWGRAMEEHAPDWSPLARIPPRDDRRWCVALGHGFFYAQRQRPERSSPIFADEIRDSGWDYVALGHHHVQTDVSQGGVVACFSGAPALAPADAGRDDSVLLVEFADPGGACVRPRSIF